MILTLFDKGIMSWIPRRLRSLKIPMQADESVQPDEEKLEGPPAIDDLLPKKPPDSTSHIKIICNIRRLFFQTHTYCDVYGLAI